MTTHAAAFSLRCAALLLATLALPPLAVAAPAPGIHAARPLPDLHWRLLGPFRGGWGTMAAGIADEPDTFYFGAAGGGVWKTSNAGRAWAPIFDGAGTASSIGAIAIAPSDAKIIYVGSGQPEPRYDIAAGDGVYRSSDGGQSWTHVGLENTRHIGAIWVDPRAASTLLVGATGHLFGPNAERGVFRSEDGGKTWAQTLTINADTGVVDLAADPTNPSRVFAAAWEARNYPWLSYFRPIKGPGSAIYASSDGGKTWAKLGGAGWPEGALGRIGLAVTHTKAGTRIYASIDAAEKGGLFRSDDDGAHWQKVNDAEAVTSWYESRLTVAPSDPDTVYMVGQSIHRSTDAGKTFTIIKGAPGGDDYHHLWINPKHPERMVTASDQGTVVSVDGGKSWSDWYNQPTGQFYHLAADNRFPYWVYSGQQDSGTVAIASRSDYGSLTFRDWHPVAGDERDDDLPDPADPNIVYSSGLGGKVNRWDARTGQSRNITPWPVSSYGKQQNRVDYRYTWITPLAVSAIAPHALYVGSQLLWKSVDRGEHWTAFSPDLTGKDAALTATDPQCGVEVMVKDATACGFGVIFNIAPSPTQAGVVWVGTDNGIVQVTRDDGKHWAKVSPPDLPDWARVNTVDASSLDANTAYVAADNHRQDDFAPYAWRTHDAGRSWQRISAGLPAGQFVAALRADPVKAGLLYAGTDAGVYVSLDDGDHWQPLQLNLPQAWVRDLLVHGNDLIAATQGRALWVLDDVSPLREMAGLAAETHLFKPATAFRVHDNNNHDTPLPAETGVGLNPPSGVMLDYQLAAADAAGPVALEILDAQGALVRRYASDDQPQPESAHRYFAADWLKPFAALPATPGLHRWVWDLRYPDPRSITKDYSIGAVYGVNTPTLPRGPFALPGWYRVQLLAAGGRVIATSSIALRSDPRVKVTATAMQANLQFAQTAGKALDAAWRAHGQLAAVIKQIAERQSQTKDDTALRMLGMAENYLKPLLTPPDGAETDIANVSGVIASLATEVGGVDDAPTPGQQQALARYGQQLTEAITAWENFWRQDLYKLSDEMISAGLAPITVPQPQQFEVKLDAGGMDLP